MKILFATKFFIYIFPSSYLHINQCCISLVKLVYLAPTQYQNKPLLELNGYEYEKPIAALIKSCFEIMIN